MRSFSSRTRYNMTCVCAVYMPNATHEPLSEENEFKTENEEEEFEREKTGKMREWKRNEHKQKKKLKWKINKQMYGRKNLIKMGKWKEIYVFHFHLYAIILEMIDSSRFQYFCLQSANQPNISLSRSSI